MTRFQEIGKNVHFWAKKGIFGPKLTQNGPNGSFGQNPKMSLSSHQEAPTLCQISENSYERIMSSLSNGRMHGRTDGCEFIGSTRYHGGTKIRKIHDGVWKL